MPGRSRCPLKCTTRLATGEIISPLVFGTSRAPPALMDKRRHPRFDGSELYVKLKVDGACHPGAMVENVSLGGALVTLADTPAAGKNVLLEFRAKQKVLKLVGRVIAVVPRGVGRELPGLRIRFNPTAAATIAELYALIRELPTDAEPSTDFDIDIEEDEPVLELSDVVDDEDATIIVAMQEELKTKQIRIAELERQLRQVRQNARTLEDVLLS